jgi:probable rRNA maturation factor
MAATVKSFGFAAANDRDSQLTTGLVAQHSFMIIVRKKIAGLSRSTLERFVSRAKKAARLKGTVNVLITNARELRSLNCQFRGLDKPTDVLSFPALAPGRTAGDVAISADIARENAKRLGHSLPEEIKILALHGILHLAGYDHEHDNGEMAREEIRLRQRLNLPVALIERTQPRVLTPAAHKQPQPKPPGATRRSA